MAEISDVRIIFCGDVVGTVGRRAIATVVPELRERCRPTFVIANGENAAGGLGITERTAKQIFAGGIDAITTGNHVFKKREVYDYLNRESRIVRPANYPIGNPGRGHTIVENNGLRLGIVNLSGTFTLQTAVSPFVAVRDALSRLRDRVDMVVVDLHAEATSEKVAMGWYLDGDVLAVVGTHTHVPTADARVLPKGTGYITDVGMTGPRDSVIGMKKELAIGRFLDQMPVRMETANDDVWLDAVLIEVRPDGLAASIDQLLIPAERPATDGA